MKTLSGYLSRQLTAGPSAREVLASLVPSDPDGVTEATGQGAVGGMRSDGRVRGEKGLIAAVIGRPRWRRRDLSERAAQAHPSDALLAAYREDPDGWVHHLGGHFAAAVVDLERGEAQLVTDRIGVCPLYYGAMAGDGIAFATRARDLLPMPGVDHRLAHQGLYHYVYFHMVPSPGTVFAGIHKLEPAQRVRFRDGQIRRETYWHPEFLEESSRDAAELGREMHTLLARSVAADAADTERLGAYLSGGLDSSTVAGKLAEVRPGADTFSIGFDAEGYDETPYARATASHFGNTSHEYFVTPEDVVAGVQRIAEAYDEPFGNSSALPAYFCARLAKESGVDVLLGGDGGDEIFAGNERYVTQEVFEIYQEVPKALRWMLELPYRVAPPFKRLPFFRKVDAYITQAKVPLPDRLQRYNFLHRMAAEEMFAPEFLRDVDRELPLALQRGRYHEPADATRVNRMLYFDWKFTLADNDLPKVTRTAELAGVEVRYPMISDELVEFSCRVPTNLKLKDNKLRWFYRQAMEGYLPEKVLRKSKQGFGLPFGVWMKDYAPLRDLAAASLERQKAGGVFRPEFLDRALEQHRTGHAAYYGELIWVIMMLDLWQEARHSP